MTFSRSPSHRKAVFQALLVTFLWSTSWVLIKIGLQDVPALTFAGLRYGLAFLFLLPLAMRSENLVLLRAQTSTQWRRLIALGVLYYAVTQGTQYIALAYLPAVTVSLMLNFTAVMVAFLGILFLQERLTGLQWSGIALFLVGAWVFFFPASFPAGEWVGLIAAGVCVLANALSAILGRSVNRAGNLPPLLVTTTSMGIGAVGLLLTGFLSQGVPHFASLAGAVRFGGLVLWLALVNTALAFTLWNTALRTLTAIEASIINGTMLIQIALLAWLFLGESITLTKGIGMLLAGLGALVVQLWRSPSARST